METEGIVAANTKASVVEATRIEYANGFMDKLRAELCLNLVRNTKYKLPAVAQVKRKQSALSIWLLALGPRRSALAGFGGTQGNPVADPAMRKAKLIVATQSGCNYCHSHHRTIPAPAPLPPRTHTHAEPAPLPAPTTNNLQSRCFPAASNRIRALCKIFLKRKSRWFAQGISPGSFDGAIGSQTRAAHCRFQKAGSSAHHRRTGRTHEKQICCSKLRLTPLTLLPPTTSRACNRWRTTWLGKSQQTALDFETILELVAEKSFTHPNFIRRLNPDVNWTNVPPGTTVASAQCRAIPTNRRKAAWVTIHLTAKTLEAFDADTNLLVHFPCSIAKHVEKRPVGLLHVAVVAPNPELHFGPGRLPRITRSPATQTQTHPAARAEQSGRRRVDRPRPSGLRHPRHAAPGGSGPHGIPRLLPPGELERGISAATDHHWHTGVCGGIVQ